MSDRAGRRRRRTQPPRARGHSRVRAVARRRHGPAGQRRRDVRARHDRGRPGDRRDRVCAGERRRHAVAAGDAAFDRGRARRREQFHRLRASRAAVGVSRARRLPRDLRIPGRRERARAPPDRRGPIDRVPAGGAHRAPGRSRVPQPSAVPAARVAQRLSQQPLQRSAGTRDLDGAGAARALLPHAARLEGARSRRRVVGAARSGPVPAARLARAAARVARDTSPLAGVARASRTVRASRMKRLLTIGHSYVVAANRELAHQTALQGRGAWEVTSVAPAHFQGDLRPIAAEPIANEASALVTLPVRLDRVPHLMWFGGGLREILAREWDVVHCWEEPYTFAASRIASHVPARAAFAVASFQNISKSYPWPLSAFERQTMTRAAGWIAFGHSVADTLSPRAGYAGKPHRVIPPGVDVEVFRPDEAAGRAIRASLGWAPGVPVVGYLGRFVEQKGLADLCEALWQTRAGWHALFVGGGPLTAEIERLSAAHPGRVKIVTGVPHGEVPRWLNAMTV